MTQHRSLCVYCSSRSRVAPEYAGAAEDLGREIGRRGHSLVYGGCRVGLMDTLACAVRSAGGRVIGIVPQSMHERGIADLLADELIITPGMRERKAAMEEHADAFIALPGGFGTLEEFFEIVTLKQLQYHAKPVILLNVNRFYDPLVDLFEHMYRADFARPAYRALYHVTDSLDDLFRYLDNYTPPVLESKWG